MCSSVPAQQSGLSLPQASQIDNFLKVLSIKARGYFVYRPEEMAPWINKHTHTHTASFEELLFEAQMKADRLKKKVTEHSSSSTLTHLQMQLSDY